MKKALKILGIILLVLLLISIFLFYWANETKPLGDTGQKAEALAQKMLDATNKKAWDSTYYVQWSFRGEHDYFWDRKRHFVQVEWEGNKVLLHTKSVTGKAFKANQAVSGEEANAMVKKAWGYFCNDSFWLFAFTKTHDEGVVRSYVKQEDGQEGLMVNYSSGGVTPGDSYLWLLDEKGLPKSWKMWTSIIPVQGLEITWQDWVTLPTGARVATHHLGPAGLDITITNLKGSHRLEDIGIEGDVFEAID